jgi:prepilin-type N-terminal cleavage/methylation domain-containing protein
MRIFKNKSEERGFSLIESMICLVLFLILTLMSLEIYDIARSKFHGLKHGQEKDTAAHAALEKIKNDLREGGRGLNTALFLGLLEGIHTTAGTITAVTSEKDLVLTADLYPGQTRIDLRSTSGVKKGRSICLVDTAKGEVKTTTAVKNKTVSIAAPVSRFYSKDSARVLLIREVSFYYDHTRQMVRRKVNTSSSQPLLEDAASFLFSFDKPSNLIKIQLTLIDPRKKKYETTLFPKNIALAAGH